MNRLKFLLPVAIFFLILFANNIVNAKVSVMNRDEGDYASRPVIKNGTKKLEYEVSRDVLGNALLTITSPLYVNEEINLNFTIESENAFDVGTTMYSERSAGNTSGLSVNDNFKEKTVDNGFLNFNNTKLCITDMKIKILGDNNNHSTLFNVYSKAWPTTDHLGSFKIEFTNVKKQGELIRQAFAISGFLDAEDKSYGGITIKKSNDLSEKNIKAIASNAANQVVNQLKQKAKKEYKKNFKNAEFKKDDVSNNIKFDYAYTSTIKSIKFSPEKDFTITSHYCVNSSQIKYKDAKYQTVSAIINNKTEYFVSYGFLYIADIQKLLYVVTFTPITQEKGETKEEAEKRAKEISEGGTDNAYEEAEEEIEKLLVKRLGVTAVNEERDPNTQFDDVLTDVGAYTDTKDLNTDDQKEVESMAGKILAIITNIGIVVSILIPTILGVKYMIGSVEEKAEYKKDMIPYLVGAVMLFAISTIVKIIQSIGQEINKI